MEDDTRYNPGCHNVKSCSWLPTLFSRFQKTEVDTFVVMITLNLRFNTASLRSVRMRNVYAMEVLGRNIWSYRQAMINGTRDITLEYGLQKPDGTMG